MTLPEKLKKEVDEFEKFVQQVNVEIAHRRGRIAVLEEMIREQEQEEVSNEPTE